MAYAEEQGNPGSDGKGSPKVRRVWHVEPGASDAPDVLLAGVEEAGLFQTNDRGVTWQEVPSLRAHPTAAQWEPGGGGLCLHSITLDPSDGGRYYVGISAGGAYRTVDGGDQWEPINRGVGSAYPSDSGVEGQCVHKILAPWQALPAEPYGGLPERRRRR